MNITASEKNYVRPAPAHSPRARVKRNADRRGDSHEARTDGRKGGAGHAAACRPDGSPLSAAKPAAAPTGQLAAMR